MKWEGGNLTVPVPDEPWSLLLGHGVSLGIVLDFVGCEGGFGTQVDWVEPRSVGVEA